MTLLSASAVTVRIDSTTLVDAVDLEVQAGEWISVIGPNGAGKSTLLRALSGAQDATGQIRLDGADVGAFARRERAAKIAWVPQTPTIPAGMTVVDYVLLGRTPHLHPLAAPGRADVEVVEAILVDLDLTDLAGRSVETLSGGERQRAVIGRALAQESPLLLLDEPTSALDLGHQQDVLALLDRLRNDGRRAIVTTMHDLTLAGSYADRLVLMANGAVVDRGSAADVLTHTNIATHYGAQVDITEVDGTVVVVPRVHPSSR